MYSFTKFHSFSKIYSDKLYQSFQMLWNVMHNTDIKLGHITQNCLLTVQNNNDA